MPITNEADGRAFGLAWEDCDLLLRQLGYTARVEIVPANPRGNREPHGIPPFTAPHTVV
jgi:hypothetical protein